MVVEYLSGGELLKDISSNKRYHEFTIKKLM
jgi:hypothetical protein